MLSSVLMVSTVMLISPVKRLANRKKNRGLWSTALTKLGHLYIELVSRVFNESLEDFDRDPFILDFDFDCR